MMFVWRNFSELGSKFEALHFLKIDFLRQHKIHNNASVTPAFAYTDGNICWWRQKPIDKMILYFRTMWVNSTFEFRLVIIVGKFIVIVFLELMD